MSKLVCHRNVLWYQDNASLWDVAGVLVLPSIGLFMLPRWSTWVPQDYETDHFFSEICLQLKKTIQCFVLYIEIPFVLFNLINQEILSYSYSMPKKRCFLANFFCNKLKACCWFKNVCQSNVEKWKSFSIFVQTLNNLIHYDRTSCSKCVFYITLSNHRINF